MPGWSQRPPAPAPGVRRGWPLRYLWDHGSANLRRRQNGREWLVATAGRRAGSAAEASASGNACRQRSQEQSGQSIICGKSSFTIYLPTTNTSNCPDSAVDKNNWCVLGSSAEVLARGRVFTVSAMEYLSGVSW